MYIYKYSNYNRIIIFILIICLPMNRVAWNFLLVFYILVECINLKSQLP